MRLFVFLILFTFSLLFSQDLCPKPWIQEDLHIHFEGFFINQKNSRVHIDVSWKHKLLEPDSFLVYLSSKKSFLFVTSPEQRYLMIQPENVKRQLATHHLKENIGETPLHWDDLELLANAEFLCADSSAKNKYVLRTAFSQTWYSLQLDSLKFPAGLTMRGAKNSKREVYFYAWKKYGETPLASMIKIEADSYSGVLWIHSIYKKAPLDPLKENLKKSVKNLILFPKARRKIKSPLIFQLD